MRIYISGPITGVAGYRKAFSEAAALLQERGHSPLDPAALPDLHTWRENVARDLIVMLTSCEAIFMLPGWADSAGARLEHHVAETLGMQVYSMTRLEEVPDHDSICSVCGGTGWNKAQQPWRVCWRCRGTGKWTSRDGVNR